MTEPFIHLHVHSTYSMMRGVSSLETLCAAAAGMGAESLALTDTNGFYGLVSFLETARRHNLRPIVGVHLETKEHQALALIKSPRGYALLSTLLSRLHLDPAFSLPRAFPEAPEDLAVLATDPELLDALRGKAERGVEVVPGALDRRLMQMARSLGLPPVATNAVHFAAPEDHALHRLVRAIALNRTLSTLPLEAVVSPERWLKPASEMERRLPHGAEALQNTLRFARRCHTEWERFPAVFPSYRNETTDHFDLLLDRCRKGIAWRYGETCAAVEARLSEELDLIREKGYVDYFLVVADIVLRRPIHCGRGSGAASLVSYLLGITHVDPIRHNLLFGRFLNPERKDHPDIDVDFPWDERDGLFDELRGAFGDENMAFVSNHTGFGGRAAIREVAKVYGIPAEEIKEVTRRLGYFTDPGRIVEQVRSHPRFRNFPLDPPWPEILTLASRLESLPRHLSTHCGGIILAPDGVSRHVPVQRSAKGVRIIQWEKDQTEEAGLVKIDLLGNRSLAVIRDTLAAVRENTGEIIDYPRLNPVDDPETIDLLARGESMGVFYVESPAMRLLQKKSRYGDFDHLVIHSSIIRPAANPYIREYLKRLFGEPYDPLHPLLEDLLSETYGILVYQEDVVQAAMLLAGFGWAEADGLRKVLSKKSPERLRNSKRRFFEGCARNGIVEETVQKIWEMILSFAGYSFCKPHSASYALVSFKSAYLKRRFPAEFMAAVISNGGGYYSTFAYVSEARRMGLTVLGPDVNESARAYRGRGKTIRMGFLQLQNIRTETLEAIIEERKRNGPFRHIVDFRERIPILPAEGAVLVKSGALDSIACGLNRPRMLWYLESRSRAGGNSEGKHAPRGGEQPDGHPGRCSVPPTQAAFRFPVRREHPRPQILNRGTPRSDLSSPLPFPRFDPESLGVPLLPDFDERRKWSHERETLGFVLSVHPLKLFDAAVRALPYPVLPASELHHAVGRRVRVLGWRITAKEVLTKEGEQMEFVSFEDETSIYEAVLFPDAYRRFCQDLDRDRPYVLYGIVESEFGAENLNVLELRKLDRPAGWVGESGRRAARSPAPGPSTTPCASGGRGG